MKFEEFYDEVIMALGGSLVDVELEENDIKFAFKKAKRTFQQKGNDTYKKSFYRLPVQSNQTVYPIPNSVHTIIRVIKPTAGFIVEDAFSLAAYNQLFNTQTMSSTGDWLSYELTLQSIENWKRYMAFDVQFHHDEFNNTITLFKAPQGKEQIWLLELYSTLTDEQYMDVLWVQNWAIAEAKAMLGAAYKKFSQLPGPDGSVSLDGNSLIQESTEEKRQLLEDIQNGVDGGDNFWGVYLA